MIGERLVLGTRGIVLVWYCDFNRLLSQIHGGGVVVVQIVLEEHQR